jgi:NAD(P)-dependent dehydrogenase (short-subunit alcohol dehydrogenase family)
VRDRPALAALIADVTARFGRIDGVIHGAGVIEDKLLRDKTPESFDRVFGVKVESAHALSELLDPEELKFCAFFASIASRYGNRGQSDYAAANEVLGKLALELDRRWPARVFSVAWGPWTRVGMVAELEPHLEARGVALIDPAIGAERFIEELEFGWKGESEVLIAGGAEHVTKPPARIAEQATA